MQSIAASSARQCASASTARAPLSRSTYVSSRGCSRAFTGTVLFTPTQSSGFVVRNTEVYDSLGRREIRPVRMWMERKGFILSPKFIFIDGRTGTVLHSEQMREERLYSTNQNTPALSSYFEMMDGIIPSFLGTLSMQKIRGTRILLR